VPKSNSNHSMVHIISGVVADSGSVNSTLVISESSNNFISNRDWTMFEDGMEQFCLIPSSDVN